ncbi:TonB-dependent siderophore receptor [Pseudomonas baltica]|uniref:TonB-dependent siderophore receptor n=1 Tax=Pseudomonas baltica TaxID=2762576 RepID=UPI00289B4C9C|nr:TonB-dependent siderophore receptor [Pseudomonas baltica]
MPPVPLSLFSVRPVALAIALGLTGASCAVLSPLANAAQGAASYNIPAGPLSTRLNQFAAQAGIYLAGNGALTSGKNSPALQGNYTPQQGLAILLEGSGIWAVAKGDGHYELQPRPRNAGAIDLDETNIEGRANTGAANADNDVGFVAHRSSAGSKTDTPLIEIPQSLSVITRQQMDTQNVQSVSQALRYVPGVKTETYGVDPKGYDWLYIRGFNAQTSSDYRDGLRQLSNSYTLFRSEPYDLERIEVVRGPSSSLFGQGDAGGIINRVSKMPTPDGVHEVEIGFGSHDRTQTRFDLGDRIDDAGTLAYRVVGVARKSNTQFEYDDGHEIKDDRLYIAPSLTWAPDDDTSLTFLSDFLRDTSGGTVAVDTPNYGHTSSTLLGDHSFNHSDQQQFSLGYQFRHRLNDNVELRQNLRYGQVDFILNNLLPLGTLGSIAPALASSQQAGYWLRTPRRFDEHLDTFTVDNQVQFDFDTAGIGHTLVTGIDYAHFDSNVKRYQGALTLSATLPFLLNPDKPVYGLNVARPTALAADYHQTQDQVGYYLQDQIKVGDHWIVTAGGRYDDVRSMTDNHLSSTDTTGKDHAFTGRLGLTYVTDFGLAPYVSYAESFIPNSGTASNGSTFEASQAHQWETGLKYQPNDAVLLTLAAFDITKTNVLTQELVNGVITGFNQATGEVRSRGIEAEAKARLGEHWDLLGSYTYTDAEITRSNNGDKGNSPANVPRHMASGWLNYTFKEGPLNGLSLGGGVRYVGELYGDNTHVYKVDSYTLFDAGASYPLTKKVTVALNVENLANKHYVGTCDDINSCYPGETRTVLGSVRYRW